MTKTQVFLQGAWLTVSRLFGGLILGLFLGIIVFELIPGSSQDNPAPVHASIAALPVLIGFFGGGAAWGISMAGLTGYPDRRKAAIAGLVGFSPISFILVVGLGMLEPMIVNAVGPGVPIHRLFTILFTTAAFLIAGISSWTLAARLGVDGGAVRHGLVPGVTAAVTFLVVNLTMEAMGWVVGAPGAALRATMLVVMFTGNFFAAVTAGGVLGLTLRIQERYVQPAG